jgi:transcription termination factor Rho
LDPCKGSSSPWKSTPGLGTRKEERLLGEDVLKKVTLLRRTMVQMKPVEAMEMLVKKMAQYPSNAAFLDKIGGYVKA